MPPMLVVKRKMNTIKEFGKGDNARQRPHDITHFFKNNSSRNAIKSIFDIDLHYSPIRV
jgi:hypothetical protein